MVENSNYDSVWLTQRPSLLSWTSASASLKSAGWTSTTVWHHYRAQSVFMIQWWGVIYFSLVKMSKSIQMSTNSNWLFVISAYGLILVYHLFIKAVQVKFELLHQNVIILNNSSVTRPGLEKIASGSGPVLWSSHTKLDISLISWP